METQIVIANVMRWIARIVGTSMLIFTMYFIMAHLIGDNGASSVMSTTDKLSSTFGLISLLGLGLALKWEGLGGMITTLGMVGFFIVRPDLIAEIKFVGAVLTPGLLYLAYWFFATKNNYS